MACMTFNASTVNRDIPEDRRSMPTDGTFHYLDRTGHCTDQESRLRYAFWPATVEQPRGTIILMPGRAEFIEKFYETIGGLRNRGFAVYGLDWRGQGGSDRFLENREHDYVPDYQCHVDDLQAIVTMIRETDPASPLITLANSMGNAVMFTWLHDYQPDDIAGAVSWVPMLGIRYKGVPPWLANTIPSLLCKLGLGKKLAIGEKGYIPGLWGWRSKLTHDLDRFEDADYFMQSKPEVVMGGVTNSWVVATQRILKKLHSPGFPEAIKTPTLIVQASDDHLVRTDSQSAFAKRLPNVGLVRIEGAYHELHKEKDEYRDLLWEATDHFLDQIAPPNGE